MAKNASPCHSSKLLVMKGSIKISLLANFCLSWSGTQFLCLLNSRRFNFSCIHQNMPSTKFQFGNFTTVTYFFSQNPSWVPAPDPSTTCLSKELFGRNRSRFLFHTFLDWNVLYVLLGNGKQHEYWTKRLKNGKIITSTFVAQVLRGVRVRAEAEEAAGKADHCDRGGFCSHQKDARWPYEGWVSDLMPHWESSKSNCYKSRKCNLTWVILIEYLNCWSIPLP